METRGFFLNLFFSIYYMKKKPLKFKNQRNIIFVNFLKKKFLFILRKFKLTCSRFAKRLAFPPIFFVAEKVSFSTFMYMYF